MLDIPLNYAILGIDKTNGVRIMKAIQKYNADTNNWEYVYDYPMTATEAAKEIKQQRGWAKDDDRDDKYRSVNVVNRLYLGRSW